MGDELPRELSAIAHADPDDQNRAICFSHGNMLYEIESTKIWMQFSKIYIVVSKLK